VPEVLLQRLIRPFLLGRNSAGRGRLDVTAAKILPDLANGTATLLHFQLLLAQLECEQRPLLSRQPLATITLLLLYSLQLYHPTAAQFARQWLTEKLQLFPLPLEDAQNLGAAELRAHSSSVGRQGPRGEEQVHKGIIRLLHNWHQLIGW
jgi:hypothetical protein